MGILLVGGTGTVGSATLNMLVANGYNAKVMTRSVDNFDKLPKGAAGVVGHLGITDTLKTAFENVEHLFLMTPVVKDETELGLNAVAAAKAAGVQKIVYLSEIISKKTMHIPHFKSKIPVVEAIKESGIAYTILEPNLFIQNDYWYFQVIKTHGVYPQPIGQIGINCVDIRDVANAVANALTMDKFEGKHYKLHGPDTLTADGIAKIYSEAMGKEIRYKGDDLDKWVEASTGYIPTWLQDILRVMYKYYQENGLIATEEELKMQEEILGHAPRTLRDFVRDSSTR